MTSPSSVAVPFSRVPVGGRFVANQWGDGKDHVFVKRDARTATAAEHFDAHGHPARGWVARTLFSAKDAVLVVTK